MCLRLCLNNASINKFHYQRQPTTTATTTTKTAETTTTTMAMSLAGPGRQHIWP